MNKEQQLLIDEAYENYCKSFENKTLIEEYSFDTDSMTQVMFINKCKTNPEFSEKWGLTIEERELSLEERVSIWDNKFLKDVKPEEVMDNLDLDGDNIPKRAISLRYNHKTITSYE